MESCCHLLRISNGNFHFLTLGEWSGEEWLDWENKELIEFEQYKVTHFCIPDPIEIE